MDYIFFLLSFLSEKLFSNLVLDRPGLLILCFQIENASFLFLFFSLRRKRGKRGKRTAGKERGDGV